MYGAVAREISQFDTAMLRFAYEIAAIQSVDPSTQNAAVIVDRNGCIIAEGVNELPQGVEILPERWIRPGKYQFVEHAERNAIYAAARSGFSTEFGTMYCPWFACADCARAIIQAGIKRVVGHDMPEHKEREDWNQSIAVADGMLREAGVQVARIHLSKSGLFIRMNGKRVEV